MDEDDRDDQLEEILAVVKENNKILRKMHRTQVWSGVLRLMYWAVIIGASIGAWYYFQPILDDYMKTYQSLMGNMQDLGGSASGSMNMDEIKKFLGSE